MAYFWKIMKHLPKRNLYIYFQKNESREKPKKLPQVVLCFRKNVGNHTEACSVEFSEQKKNK